MSGSEAYDPKPVVLFEVWEPRAKHPLIITSVREHASHACEPGDQIVKRLWLPASPAESPVGQVLTEPQEGQRDERAGNA